MSSAEDSYGKTYVPAVRQPPTSQSKTNTDNVPRNTQFPTFAYNRLTISKKRAGKQRLYGRKTTNPLINQIWIANDYANFFLQSICFLNVSILLAFDVFNVTAPLSAALKPRRVRRRTHHSTSKQSRLCVVFSSSQAKLLEQWKEKWRTLVLPQQRNLPTNRPRGAPSTATPARTQRFLRPSSLRLRPSK